jgi:hypothetical protein
MGKSGVSLEYAKKSESTKYLSEKQIESAYSAGKDAADTFAKGVEEKNKAQANGKTGRKKGVVRGDGVSIADLKKSFNDTQNIAYKLLNVFAEATGVDIVLYKSATNENGEFIGAQGRFKWSEGAVHLDLNAGLANINDVDGFANYTILRTFAHEFTHFIEKWNPVQYNEFRKLVFDTLTERGQDVDGLIREQMELNSKLTYDGASREVVAEAMTDILPDSNFVQELAENHKSIFNKLLEQLKQFIADLKAYFKSINPNKNAATLALQEQVGDTIKYLDSIVKALTKRRFKQ